MIGPFPVPAKYILRCLNRLEKITSGEVVVDGTTPYPTPIPISIRYVRTSVWCSSISTCFPI